ncbi:MAG: hypothetical protein HZB53_19240 [Chloroflexi bacterium]|nr:hypothetical protein [Chloroflexota bacterium]
MSDVATNIPERGLEQWAPIVIDYLYQLVGDAHAVESLAGSVMAGGASSDPSLSAEQAFLRMLSDATDAACNYLQPRGEADRLKPLLNPSAESPKRDRDALDSIIRAARHLPVLKRASLALADQLGLSLEQLARVLRQPPDHAGHFLAGARREYARELNEITRMRSQAALGDIAPAVALGLRARHGYAGSAFAFVPAFSLPAERMSLLLWSVIRQGKSAPPASRSASRGGFARLALLALVLMGLSLGGGWIAYNMWLSNRPVGLPLRPSATPIDGIAPSATPATGALPPSPVLPTRTPAPTATRAPIATPIPTTSSTATPTATLPPGDTATPTPTPAALATATSTTEPLEAAPTGTPTTAAPALTSTPVPPTATRRIVPRAPTSTPTRVYIYVPPTRTPTRVPTATATFAPHTPSPTVFHPTITPTP